MLNHLILFVIVFNYYGNCNDQSYSCYPNEMNSESLGRVTYYLLLIPWVLYYLHTF